MTTAHPRVPNPIPMVLDLARHHTLVELPTQMEGTMKSITLENWQFDSLDDPGPYFQIKFSNGLELRNLTFGGRTDTNDIVGAPMSDAIQVPVRGRGLRVPVISHAMFSRVFAVELFDSLGNPFNPERCVLWFHIHME